jgi:1-acyl-sn-glycerol-3-phosphate acyltransferase
MTWLRSLAFLLWFVLLTAAMGTLFLPLLAGPRAAARWMARHWARATLGGLEILAGTGMAIRGRAPEGAALIASKHMSMWDTLALFMALDRPAFVMKRELLWIPFFGWYVWKAAAIPIDRDGKAKALRRMTRAAQKVLAEGRPIVIFPEGTRKKPGMPPDYKPGVAGLYALLGRACVPVALDSGRYWTGFVKKPGVITLAFLEPVAPGLRRDAFMALLQQRIETATAALLER